jgi:hypothetical protein
MQQSEQHDDLIERQIKHAQEEGAFDALPGAGQPFSHLGTEPLGNTLRAQGFTAHWIELDHEIRQKTAIAEQSIRRTYEWVRQSLSGGSADQQFARDEWRRARRIFRGRIEEINKLIRTYNLHVPPAIGQRFILDEEAELERLGLATEIG